MLSKYRNISLIAALVIADSYSISTDLLVLIHVYLLLGLNQNVRETLVSEGVSDSFVNISLSSFIMVPREFRRDK